MICLLKLEIMIYYFSFTVAFLAPLSRERNVTHLSLVYLVIKYTFSRVLNCSNLFDGWIKTCLGVPMYKLRRENGKIWVRSAQMSVMDLSIHVRVFTWFRFWAVLKNFFVGSDLRHLCVIFSTLYVSLRKTYVNRTHFLFSTTVSRTSMLQNESLKNCRQTERKVFQG